EDLGDADAAAADARAVADAHALVASLLSRVPLSVTLGDQSVFEAVLAALGLPRGWQKRLARAFGVPDVLEAALADLARPAGNGALAGPVAALVAAGEAGPLAAHVEQEMHAAGLSPSAGRGPQDVARRLLEK